MKKQLLERLKPLYSQFHEIIPEDYGLFCLQWGKNFPQTQKSGILFVGRAINGWINNYHDVDVLFGESNDRIFARHDQMEWVHNLEGNTNGYNTNSSAFWRVIKGVSQHLYSKEWYNNVAWSNLCKAAPAESGNPSESIFFDTLKLNREILRVEIDTLSPKFVIMLTNNNWAKHYLRWLNDDQENHSITKADWGDYTAKLYLIKGTYFIVSEHPMKKEEQSHIESIISLIEKTNSF